MKPSRILGKAGDDNFRVEDCPVHLPKENMKFFQYMRKEANTEPFNNYKQYGNAYHDDWQEKPSVPDKNFAIRVMEAVRTGLAKALNENTTMVNKKFSNRKFIDAFLDRFPGYVLNNATNNCIVFLDLEHGENRLSFYIKSTKISSSNPFYSNTFTFTDNDIDEIQNCDYVVVMTPPLKNKQSSVFIVTTEIFMDILNSDKLKNFLEDHNYNTTEYHLIPSFFFRERLLNTIGNDKLGMGTMFTIK